MTKIVFFLLFLLRCLTFSSYAQDIKITHGPYLQNMKETEVTVAWETDQPSVGWVELAPDDGSHFYATERRKYFDTKAGIKKISTLHTVRLSGLNAGTTYRYRILAQEVTRHHRTHIYYGDVAATDVYRRKPLTFKTNDRNKKNVSFIILNDVHNRENLISPLLHHAGMNDKDAVIFNGDMVSEFTDKETIFTGFMDESITSFAKETPLYYARGNHETRGEFAIHFQDYFSPYEQHLYFTFRQGPVFFIILDTGEDKPDNDIEYAGITDYDTYRSEQAEWLKKVLLSEECMQSPFKVVIAHIPPLPIDHAWHGSREVMDKFVPLLNNAGIDMMICGHLHRHAYQEPSDRFRFPILVNSNNACATVTVKEQEMNIKVYELDGKVSFNKTYTAQ